MAKYNKSTKGIIRHPSAEKYSSQYKKNRRTVSETSQTSPKGLNSDLKNLYWLYGTHTVQAALANPKRKKYRILVDKKLFPSHNFTTDKFQTEYVSRHQITQQLDPEIVHQGLALLVLPLQQPSIEEVCRGANKNSAIVILDQVTDPRNIGAIMRSAAAFGASAIIAPEKYSPDMTATLEKAAAGAADLLPMVRVANLARAIKQLKEFGYWIYGLDSGANQSITRVKLNGKLALVLGAEGSGLRRLTAKHCDHLVNIPIRPTVGSLNVSVAASIALFEFIRKS